MLLTLPTTKAMNKVFRNKLGQVYLELEYDAINQLVHANYIGCLTMELVLEGQQAVLETLIEYNCCRYLNNNTKLVGGWDFANDWVRDKWLPEAVQAGLKYLAHIMAPEAQTIRAPMEELEFECPAGLEIMFFDNETEARVWLTTHNC
jgi:hypothetical protein